MSSIGDVVRNTLIQDYTDTTAEAVYLANTLVFSSSADVPNYLYQSLATLFGVVGLSGLSSIITANQGKATTKTKGLVIQHTMEWEAVCVREGNRSDQSGARTSTVHIGLRNLVTTKDYSQIDNILQRVVYLLDFYTRENRTTPTTVDLTIDSSIKGFYQHPFRLSFIKAFVNDASEIVVEFRAEFYRIFV